MDNKVITNEDNTKVIEFVINGISYKRRNNEDYNKFYNRVSKKAQRKGVDLTSILTSQDFKKEVKEVKQASNNLISKIKNSNKKAIIALALIVTLGTGATLYGCGQNKKADNSSKVASEVEQEYTNNAELNKILIKIAETEEGEQIVSQLLDVYEYQKIENNKLLNYPDAEGNVLFYESREVLAIQDFSNAENYKMMALDYNDTRVCDYLDAAYVAIPAMYVTGDSNNEYTLIKDQETKEKMKKQEIFAEDVMAGKKSASEIDAHFDDLMETGLTYSSVGVNTAYLGEADNITIENRSQSKKLNNFIEYVTEDNKGINTLQDSCVAKSNTEGLTEEQYDLVAEALVIMDKENIKVEKESRDRFDASTTEKGKSVSKSNGTFKNEQITTIRTSKTEESKKISKDEAEKNYGKDEVKEAEKEADNRDKVVDTDGDGKADSTITDANEKEEEKKEDLEEQASSYEADYAQGQADGYAGRAKSKNTPGYNAGYANGQKRRNAEQEEDKVISQEVTYNSPAPTNVEEAEDTYSSPASTNVEETTNTEKKVIKVESDGVVYETTIEPTAYKVRSYGAQV